MFEFYSKKGLIFGILVFMSNRNFMLSWFELEKSFITSLHRHLKSLLFWIMCLAQNYYIQKAFKCELIHEILVHLLTVNSEIFARILVLRIALKDIFVTFKNRHYGMIYIHQYMTEWFLHFTRVLFSWNFAYAKFRENKTLAKFPNLLYYVFKLPILRQASTFTQSGQSIHCLYAKSMDEDERPKLRPLDSCTCMFKEWFQSYAISTKIIL